MSAWEWYNPWYLLLLPVFVLMCILAWRRPRPSLKFTATDNLVSLQRPVRQRLPIILMLMGILLFILALARPREVNVQRFKSSSGIDIMIAIDLSGSMAAVDLPVDAQLPDFREALLKDEMKDRLDVAKEEIDRFIFKRPSDRMGLIAFSGQSYTACPPTLDHNFLREHLKQLQHGILNEDSTALAPPILTADNQLKASGGSGSRELSDSHFYGCHGQ